MYLKAINSTLLYRLCSVITRNIEINKRGKSTKNFTTSFFKNITAVCPLYSASHSVESELEDFLPLFPICGQQKHIQFLQLLLPILRQRAQQYVLHLPLPILWIVISMTFFYFFLFCEHCGLPRRHLFTASHFVNNESTYISFRHHFLFFKYFAPENIMKVRQHCCCCFVIGIKNMLRWSHIFVDWLPTTIGSLHIKCVSQYQPLSVR